jgi:large subunit ribosomal protein L1
VGKESKRFEAAKQAVDPLRLYSPLEAVKLIKSLQPAKFDETMEIHIKLGINPRHADQQLRGTMMLPHGTGKDLRVAVFAKGDKATEAEEAGADIVGAEDLAERVQNGFLDFDAAVATPDMMGTVGKLGRVLGPRGLMPNPKAGTVTFDVGKAVRDMKAGKIEYRTDKFGVVHLIIGKKSFDEKALVENYGELIDEIIRAKPAAAKGKYLRSISMSSTMGPGLNLDPSKTRGLLEEEATA